MKTNAKVRHAAAHGAQTHARSRGWGPLGADGPQSGHDFAAVTVHAAAPAAPAGAPIQRMDGGRKGKKKDAPQKLGGKNKRQHDKLPKDVHKHVHAFKAATRMGAADQVGDDEIAEIREGMQVEEEHREQARKTGKDRQARRAAEREKVRAEKPALRRNRAVLKGIIDAKGPEWKGAQKLLNAMEKNEEPDEPMDDFDEEAPILHEDEPKRDLKRPPEEDDEEGGGGGGFSSLPQAVEV